MLVGRVVDDQIEHYPHAARVIGFRQRVEIRQRAKRRIDGLIVQHVVFMVACAGEKRCKPNAVYAERLQIVRRRGYAGQIAHAVAVRIAERRRKIS